MPENEKEENDTHKETPTKFVAIPSKDGPLYFQVYVLCGGICTKDVNEPISTQSFPANQKVTISMMSSSKKAFYFKSNAAFPSRNKCIGLQLVLTTVNVNTQELSEQDREKYELAFEMSKSLLPPFSGIRAKFIQDIKSASEDGVSPPGSGKKRIETLTPFTAPLYLYKKTGEIVDSYRDPSGKFDLKDLNQRSKAWFVSHLKFHSQNLGTFQPFELTKQTLKFLFKTIQDFVNKRE